MDNQEKRNRHNTNGAGVVGAFVTFAVFCGKADVSSKVLHKMNAKESMFGGFFSLGFSQLATEWHFGKD